MFNSPSKEKQLRIRYVGLARQGLSVKGDRTPDSASREGGVLLRLTMRAQNIKHFNSDYFSTIKKLLQQFFSVKIKKDLHWPVEKKNINPLRKQANAVLIVFASLYNGWKIRQPRAPLFNIDDGFHYNKLWIFFAFPVAP